MAVRVGQAPTEAGGRSNPLGLQHVANFRECGAGLLRPRRVFRGGDMSFATPEDQTALLGTGVSTLGPSLQKRAAESIRKSGV